MLRIVLAVIFGTVLGVVCAKYLLVGSAWVLVPWAIAAVGLGLWADNKKDALVMGLLYGFFLAYSFMIAGYSGSSTVYSRLVPFVVFGAIGALCGAALSVVSHVIYVKGARGTVHEDESKH